MAKDRKNPNCDGSRCTSEHGQVRVLPIGHGEGGSNLIVCRTCYYAEMSFRRDRIKDGVPFDLPEWDTLKIYDSNTSEVHDGK